MPNVSSAGGSFKDCSMLHSVDFGRMLTKLCSSDFEGSGLLSLSIPNATHNLSAKNVFASSTLLSIYAPAIKRINDYDFAYCKYLQNIDAGKVSYLGTHCFDGCTMLKEFDASNIETIALEALSFCYIDVFDAPKIKVISLFEKYLTYSYIRVLKLPNLTGVLDPKCFDNSYAEEMYFDNVTRMSAGFKASENLKILYMPRCSNYIDTKTTASLHGDKQSPLQVLWIPNCSELTYDASELKLLFAPSLTKINLINVNNLSMVLSEKLNSITMNFSVNGSAKIFAPEASYAASYANNNDIPLVTNENAISVVSYSNAYASFKIRNKVFDFSSFNCAGSIKYGCLYDYKINELSENAQKLVFEAERNNEDKTLSMSFSDLPDVNDKSDITLRAYMDIDGVRFYSPVITINLNGPQICSEHINVCVTGVDDSCFIYTCEDCCAVFTVESSDVMALWKDEYINCCADDNASKDVRYLDVVNDGIINIKDYALILKTSSTALAVPFSTD